MNFNQYKNDFTKAASEAGYSEQNIQKCLAYSSKLFEHDVPVIYNTRHLAALVGYNKIYLRKAAYITSYYYTTYTIKKKNGKSRVISEPLPSLKEIQTWILENILNKIPVSSFAKAYIPKVGLKQNLVFHKGQKKVLVLDVTDFFTSIKLEYIQEIFKSFGYSDLLSNLLAKLCCLNKCLPQGAPTSPYLSNIFFHSADDKISDYCVHHHIRYTRYADDLTFSGDFDENALQDVVFEAVEKLELKINIKKTKLMTPNTRQTVTGIVVNEKLQVSFQKRNKIRQELFYIKRFGLENHKQHIKITQANYLSHLLGEINFILYINPDDREFKEYKMFLHNLRNHE